jgi:hypothetical protein
MSTTTNTTDSADIRQDAERVIDGRPDAATPTTDLITTMVWMFGLPLLWPYASLAGAAELMHHSLDTVYRGGDVGYGDGKPIVLVPGHLGGDVTLEPLSMWLRGIGYRPVRSNVLININDRSLDEPVAAALRAAARRIGRKAVMIALDTGFRAALRVAAAKAEFVSDVIALGLPDQLPPQPSGVNMHIIENASRMPTTPGRPNFHLVSGTRTLLSINPAALRIIASILRDIPISLLEERSAPRHT